MRLCDCNQDLPKVISRLVFCYHYGDRNYERALAESKSPKSVGLPNESEAYFVPSAPSSDVRAVGGNQTRQFGTSRRSIRKHGLLINLWFSYMAPAGCRNRQQRFLIAALRQIAANRFMTIMRGFLGGSQWKGDLKRQLKKVFSSIPA